MGFSGISQEKQLVSVEGLKVDQADTVVCLDVSMLCELLKFAN